MLKAEQGTAIPTAKQPNEKNQGPEQISLPSLGTGPASQLAGWGRARGVTQLCRAVSITLYISGCSKQPHSCAVGGSRPTLALLRLRRLSRLTLTRPRGRPSSPLRGCLPAAWQQLPLKPQRRGSEIRGCARPDRKHEEISTERPGLRVFSEIRDVTPP